MNSEHRDDRICLQLKGPYREDNVYKLLALYFINVIVLLEIVFHGRDTPPSRIFTDFAVNIFFVGVRYASI